MTPGRISQRLSKEEQTRCALGALRDRTIDVTRRRRLDDKGESEVKWHIHCSGRYQQGKQVSFSKQNTSGAPCLTVTERKAGLHAVKTAAVEFNPSTQLL